VSHQITLELKADMAGLETADQALDEFGAHMAWPEPALFQLRLVLEEIMMNVISYGSDGGAIPHVRLHLSQQDTALAMEIADDGVAFDPLQAPSPDLDADIDDRPIGGLGVFLVRELMDSVTYRREAGWNRLSVTKALS
jgi:anti-sigma regulatory factor (Ser/Thr protein kinase)